MRVDQETQGLKQRPESESHFVFSIGLIIPICMPTRGSSISPRIFSNTTLRKEISSALRQRNIISRNLIIEKIILYLKNQGSSASAKISPLTHHPARSRSRRRRSGNCKSNSSNRQQDLSFSSTPSVASRTVCSSPLEHSAGRAYSK